MNDTSLSLLDRLKHEPDPSEWQRFVDIYSPLICRWLTRMPLQNSDHEDLTQEILAVVVQKVPDFERRREGSFRAWLRVITANCLKVHWRSKKYRPLVAGGSDFQRTIQDLEDPQSSLTHVWDTEHDRHVVRRLLEIVGSQFEPKTLVAFRKVVLEGQKSAQVAEEMGISVNAVLLAKSRILRRLRQELVGFLD